MHEEPIAGAITPTIFHPDHLYERNVIRSSRPPVAVAGGVTTLFIMRG
jgi:hypothetical protein